MADKQEKRWMKAVANKFKKAISSGDFTIVQANEDSLEIFYVLLQPTGGHYAGQTHILEFKTKYGKPVNYFPFKCPLVKFLTKIYHPNVSSAGSICVDIFTNPKQWSPSYDFNAVMSSIILLLDTPNNSSPYNGTAANIYRKCEKDYISKTKDQKMNVKELDIIYNKSFKSFDTEAKKYAQNKSILEQYLPFFKKEEE